MKELTIRYPDELPGLLRKTDREFADEARFLLAAKLYELGRLTSGQAARLCGRERVDFLAALARLGVPACNLRPEDADADIDFGLHG